MKDYEFITVGIENPSDVSKCAENLRRYMGRGEKMFYSDAQEYILELRDCDRNWQTVS